MKKIIILFLLLVPLALAATQTSEDMDIGSSATVSGKTVTILDAEQSGKLKVSVDGVKGIVNNDNTSTNVNEMFITIVDFFRIDQESIEASLELRNEKHNTFGRIGLTI